MDALLSDWAWWATIAVFLSPLATVLIGFFLIDSWKGVWLCSTPGLIATMAWLVIIGKDNWRFGEESDYVGIGLCLFGALIPAVWGVLAANAAALGWILRRRFLPRAIN